MAGTVKVDQTLDCKGLLCPLPVIRTKQAIDKMAVGQVLEMVSTDRGSVADMAAWSKRTGHELLEHRLDNGLFLFFIRKAK
ncbi:MAG TPA: sulfurtransferase TusA family protein [Nitrospiria bacterium]